MRASKKSYVYGRISKARSTDMPIDVQFKLFDSLVLPIMTYSCEIWGHENFALLEKLHLKFCKIALKIRTSTSGYMVYGERGRYALRVTIMKRMIGYWCTILLSKQKSLRNELYRIMYNTGNSTNGLNKIKNILDIGGLSDIWINQSFSSKTWLGLTVEQRTEDQFIQEWQNDMLGSNKGTMYLNTKSSFESEK